jgi:hypothetical protein
VPTVTFCSTAFQMLATLRRAALGLPELPLVFVPHPMMTRTPAELEDIADQVLGEVVRALTGGAPAQDAAQ